MKKVTIQDIADRMGLSRNTVAKALNGGLVSPQTRQAVLQKAWQMDYQKLDRGLLEEAGSTFSLELPGTIFVLFDQIRTDFSSRLLTGITNAADNAGYRLQVHVADRSDKDGEETARLITDDVRAVIVVGVFSDRFVRTIGRRKLPMTFFDSPVDTDECRRLGDIVTIEGFYAMRSITDHVIRQKGCTRLAYVGAADRSYMMRSRYLGFLDACRNSEIQPDARLEYTCKEEGCPGDALVEDILALMPDAAICEDDDVAGYVWKAVAQRDPEAARKLVLTGFGNSAGAGPAKGFITADVRVEELGRRLVRSAIDKIECPTMDRSVTMIAAYPRL